MGRKQHAASEAAPHYGRRNRLAKDVKHMQHVPRSSSIDTHLLGLPQGRTALNLELGFKSTTTLGLSYGISPEGSCRF
jgi:hypothetical protein